MRRTLLVLVFVGMLAGLSVLAATSQQPAGTGGNDAGIGTVAWTNTGNITVSDDTRATASLAGNEISNYITATNFGFSVPVGSTIDGITAEIEVGADASFSDGEHSIRIIKGGTIQGDDKSANGTWGGVGGADQVKSYGGASDKWSLSWTPADINASNFGVAAACDTNGVGAARECRVDSVTITITYTPGGMLRRVYVLNAMGLLLGQKQIIRKTIILT